MNVSSRDKKLLVALAVVAALAVGFLVFKSAAGETSRIPGVAGAATWLRKIMPSIPTFISPFHRKPVLRAIFHSSETDCPTARLGLKISF